MQGDISSFTLFLNGLTKPDTAEYTDDYDIKPYDFHPLPSIVSLLTISYEHALLILHIAVYVIGTGLQLGGCVAQYLNDYHKQHLKLTHQTCSKSHVKLSYSEIIQLVD